MNTKTQTLQSDLTIYAQTQGVEAFKKMLDSVLAELQPALPDGHVEVMEANESKITIEAHAKLLSQAKLIKQRIDKHKHLIKVLEPQLNEILFALDNTIVADDNQDVQLITDTSYSYPKKAFVALNGLNPKETITKTLRIV